MNLVLPVFYIILILAVTIILSDIRLNVKKCDIHNIYKNRKTKDLSKEFLIFLEFYLFGIIKIARIKITKEKLDKLKLKKDLKSIKNDVSMFKRLHILEAIKKLKIKVKRMNLNLELGLDSLNLTVYAVTLISSLIGILSGVFKLKNSKYYVLPLYNFGNSINLDFKFIANIKIIYIIFALYFLLKKQKEYKKNKKLKSIPAQ